MSQNRRRSASESSPGSDSLVLVSGRAPHPIPYQGSKRLLAGRILTTIGQRRFSVLHEPFAGSAAIAIAAAGRGLATQYRISDTLSPLVGIWQAILSNPTELADSYERLWKEQLDDGQEHFNRVRDEFNAGTGSAAHLLYLLARCVKNSPRFNRDGLFNQSPDKRRKGMRPEKMRREISGASTLLADRSTAFVAPFEEALASATSNDLVYLDPPWEGTSTGRDRRYHAGLARDRLVAELDRLNRREVPVLLSYDGRSGDKTYGDPLPSNLGLVRLELRAGRSAQATLLGRDQETVESLYVSADLLARLPEPEKPEQLVLGEIAA